jgi:hypothetical protein
MTAFNAERSHEEPLGPHGDRGKRVVVGPMMRNSVLSLVMIAIVLSGCGTGSGRESRPPGRFGDCYDSIVEEMNEQEVSRILSGYPMTWRERLVRGVNDKWGKPLKRPSAFNDHFNDKVGAIEGDHYVIVYYDQEGRVVGKDWGTWSK